MVGAQENMTMKNTQMKRAKKNDRNRRLISNIRTDSINQKISIRNSQSCRKHKKNEDSNEATRK